MINSQYNIKGGGVLGVGEDKRAGSTCTKGSLIEEISNTNSTKLIHRESDFYGWDKSCLPGAGLTVTAQGDSCSAQGKVPGT